MPHFRHSLFTGNLILPWPHQDESLETQLRIASPYNSVYTSEDSDSRGEEYHQEINPQMTNLLDLLAVVSVTMNMDGVKTPDVLHCNTPGTM